MPLGKCPYCGQVRYLTRIGVCPGCHSKAAGGRQWPPPEPTMEELDALVEEQMRCLPDWWPKTKRPDRDPDEEE